MVEEFLPKGYLYKITKTSVVSPEDFQCEFRCNINSELEFCIWLKEFQSSTNTFWILRNSVSREMSLFRLSRDYLCQHSSYRKKKEDGKDKKCLASLSVRMKRDSKFIRYRDPFVKEGYFTRIKINFKHSHSLNDTEISSWLPRTDRTKQFFVDYFDAGMCPAVAKRYHEAMISAESPDLLANSSINPPSSWIYTRYRKWLEQRQWLDENVGGLSFSEPIIPICFETLKNEIPKKSANKKKAEGVPNEISTCDKIIETLTEKIPIECQFQICHETVIPDLNEELQDPNKEVQNINEVVQDLNTASTELVTDEEMADDYFSSENMSSNTPDKYEIVPKFCYQMDRIAHLIEKSDDDALLCLVDKFANKASRVSSVSDMYDFFDTILVNHSVWKRKIKLQQASLNRRKSLFPKKSLTFRILKQNATKRKNIKLTSDEF